MCNQLKSREGGRCFIIQVPSTSKACSIASASIVKYIQLRSILQTKNVSNLKYIFGLLRVLGIKTLKSFKKLLPLKYIFWIKFLLFFSNLKQHTFFPPIFLEANVFLFFCFLLFSSPVGIWCDSSYL